MIFHGVKFGVNLFKGSIQWFDSYEEARRIEHQEIAKFAAVDAERERVRLARLGLKEMARTYSVSLPDPPPTRKHKRHV